jgi:hypothetical protein
MTERHLQPVQLRTLSDDDLRQVVEALVRFFECRGPRRRDPRSHGLSRPPAAPWDAGDFRPARQRTGAAEGGPKESECQPSSIASEKVAIISPKQWSWVHCGSRAKGT